MSNVAAAEELPKSLEHVSVAGRDQHAEDEAQPLRAVACEALAAVLDREPAFCSDEPAKRETDQTPRVEKYWQKLGGAEQTRTADFLRATQALYQLSYSPIGIAKGTSGNALLEPLADRTHVRSVAKGCDSKTGSTRKRADTLARP